MKHISILACCLFFAFTSLTYGQCVEDSHSPFDDHGWVSCQKTTSMIPERGERHWLAYDFGHLYNIIELDVWNHNVWGETGQGAKSIIIDHSTDKVNWETIGPIDLDKAPGSWKYQGQQGIDIGSAQCRYMLITVIDTWSEDSDCAGIGELRFQLDELTSTEVAILDAFDVFPNPALDFVNISLPEDMNVSLIELSNAVGQRIKTIPTPANGNLTIPIDDLYSGAYYITLISKDRKETMPFMKI